MQNGNEAQSQLINNAVKEKFVVKIIKIK